MDSCKIMLLVGNAFIGQLGAVILRGTDGGASYILKEKSCFVGDSASLLQFE